MARFNKELGKEDVIILLGDVGLNYFGADKDRENKKILADFPNYFLCIHGNHEERPYHIQTYRTQIRRGGEVYYEPEYPNILFAKDGKIYNFNGKKVMPIGGAYSIDKYYRIRNGLPWFETEQPDEAIKKYVEQKLDKVNWQLDIVLSHTVPIECEPVWAFIPGLDQSTVDKSTEKWLQYIYDNLKFI